MEVSLAYLHIPENAEMSRTKMDNLHKYTGILKAILSLVLLTGRAPTSWALAARPYFSGTLSSDAALKFDT